MEQAEWYSLACKKSIGLKHHIYKPGHWLYEVMERTIQKLKDRTESFDDLFPYIRSHGLKCRLKHYVWSWINVFWLHHQPGYQMFMGLINEVMMIVLN